MRWLRGEEHPDAPNERPVGRRDGQGRAPAAAGFELRERDGVIDRIAAHLHDDAVAAVLAFDAHPP